MKIVQGWPPNWQDIKRKFNPAETVCFTYGDTLYNPAGGYLGEVFMTHEQTHSTQQAQDPKGWWKKYIEDPIFRVDQETQAYHNQYEAFMRVEKDRNKRAVFLYKLAVDLSGPLYDNVIDHGTAFDNIKNYPNL